MEREESDSNSSSSESDEEQLAKLRSVAVDASFIKPNKEEENDEQSAPGRSKPPTEEHFLHVTPEFQQHIGKKLQESLDESISLRDIWKPPPEEEEFQSDFRLFKESVPGSDFTSRDNFIQRRRRRSSTSSDEETKLAESAVTVEDIHKQRQLLFPNKLTRGKVEVIVPTKTKKKKKKKPKIDTLGDSDENGQKTQNGADGQKSVKKKKKKKSKDKVESDANATKEDNIGDGTLTKSMKKRMRLKKLQETKVAA